MLGKIGVSISPARQGRVWALVEAEGDKTGLYRSDDFGMRWAMVSPNRDLMHRPWYYTHVFADPQHADTVYVTNLQMWKSTVGGTISEAPYPEAIGGFWVADVPSREEALEWAAKTAVACRCAQEVREFMPDPAVGN